MKNRRYRQTFRYRDCDAFAGFLHEQSLQGWHFKGFGFGLVFEQGEPADIYYAVEVFPKGTEMDTRPERETEEYAEYCEAAGWKLIDSSRKFCVFRQTQKDAVPIVEPEERFFNIRKAEWLLWMSNSIPVFLIAGVQCWQMLTLNFKNWIFTDRMFFLFFFILFACMERLAEGANLLYWTFTRKRMLRSGKIPVYGQKRLLLVRPFLLILFFVPLLYLALFPDTDLLPYILPAAITVFVILLLTAGITSYRPSRADNYLFQVVAGITFAFCGIVVLVAVVLSRPNVEYTAENAASFPFVQTDYRQINGKITAVNTDHISSTLGEKSYFMVEYTLEDGTTDSLWYTIYQSNHPWILDRLWKDEISKLGEQPEDRTEIWDAVSAFSRSYAGGACYEIVRYSDELLVLTTDEKLDEQQIACIREKLQLCGWRTYYGKRSISDIN